MPYSIDELRSLMDRALEKALPQSTLPGNQLLNDAVRDAVYPGGKRFRPLFTLLAAQAAGAQVRRAMSAACAIEFLHCSSLVFDDLPCMDDADLRRNRPTLHIRYGESIALLAGLALMNEAYKLFAVSARLVSEAANLVGVDGMIGGQASDLGHSLDFESRDQKTAALLRLTFTAGAIAGSASPMAIEILGEAGERLGRAYQMLDDLADDRDTGKTAAQDARHGRATWSSIGEARERALGEVSAVIDLLRGEFGSNADPLCMAVRCIFAQFAEVSLVAA